MFRSRALPLVLALAAIAIKVFSLDADRVERLYSTGLYPYIGYMQRILFGWIPFSAGDFLYAFAGGWLIRQLVIFIKRIKNKQAGYPYLLSVARRLVTLVLLVYIVFNILWGLNYNRRGIDYQMQLDKTDYNDEDLLLVTQKIAAKLNELQPSSLLSRSRLRSKKNLFGGAVASYERLAVAQPMLRYSYSSVKPSIYSYVGNYLGFTGYYNPFSGEAQVNTAVPLFIRPFTSCHEIGHQLGYAKESEANFAAYLSATSSSDPAFSYSVYFEMYAYASRYLYMTDSMALKKVRAQLSPGVQNDIAELRAFLRRYATPLETAVDRLYSHYLKANEQPSGKMSYNEVVALLIAYYKKNGRI